MPSFEAKDISAEEKDKWKSVSKSLGVTMRGLFKWITRDLDKIAKGMKVKK